VKLGEYKQLSQLEKADILWQNGVFVDNYSDSKVTTNLYFLFRFFVEVVVSQKHARITEITPFEKSERLEKYLDKISLKELITK
jgi:hypothetical protein